MKRTTILALLLTSVAASAMASQPLRRKVVRQTAEGKTVMVERRGDEKTAWWQADDGSRYTMDENRTLRPFAAPFADENASPECNVRKSMAASTTDGLGEYGKSGQGVVSSLGTPVFPVIMVAFSDRDFLDGNDMTKVDRFLNEEGYQDERYAVGSVGDYFDHCSYGLFRPRFEVVAKVTLPHGYKYYGAHNGSSADSRRAEAVRDAVALAETQGVDFSKFAKDSRTPLISILHAGPGEQEDYGEDYEDYLWAHFSQSVITANTTTFDSYLMTNECMRDFDESKNVVAEYMTGIGTFCHEFSHALGLPDMYDVNGKTNGTGQTPGYWDVMDYQFMYDGFRPMEYSAYERSMMGWLRVEDLVVEQPVRQHVLAPLASAAADSPQAYRIVNPSKPTEYFILENRRENSFYQEAVLGSGMLVWHIDYESSRWASNIVNTVADHQYVSVVAADGQWQSVGDLGLRDENGRRYTFPGDLFPGYANVSLFDSDLCRFFSGNFDNAVIEIGDADGKVTFKYIDKKTVGLGDVQRDAECAGHSLPIYDIFGRKLEGKPSKGLYISGGKAKITIR